MGNAESHDSFTDHVPVVGYIPAELYASEGNEEKAKRAVQRYTFATQNFVAVSAPLALAPDTGGASLMALAEKQDIDEDLAQRVLKETGYPLETLINFGGHKDLFDEKAKGWAMSLAFSKKLGSAMRLRRFYEPIFEGYDDDNEDSGSESSTIDKAEQNKDVDCKADERKEEVDMLTSKDGEFSTNIHSGLDVCPAEPGTGIKLLKPCQWFKRNASTTSNPSRVVISKIETVKFMLNALYADETFDWKNFLRKKSVPEMSSVDSANQIAEEENYDGSFMLFANSTVHRNGLPVVCKGMHFATESSGITSLDHRDRKSSYAYMTSKMSDDAMLQVESPDHGNRGLVLRVKGKPGTGQKDRFLAVGDDGAESKKKRDEESLYVYAHEDKSRAADWEMSIFDGKHIVFNLIGAGTSEGDEYLSKYKNGLYLTALDQYDRDKRGRAGDIYLSVVKSPKPIGFGLLIPQSANDDFWWMDLCGRYETKATDEIDPPPGMSIITLQQSQNHHCLDMIVKYTYEDGEEEIVTYPVIEKPGYSRELDIYEDGKVTGRIYIRREGEKKAFKLKMKKWRNSIWTYKRQWWWDLIGVYESQVLRRGQRFDHNFVHVKEVDGELCWQCRKSAAWELYPTLDDTEKLTGGTYTGKEIEVNYNEFREVKSLVLDGELFERFHWHKFVGKYKSFTYCSDDPSTVATTSSIACVRMGACQTTLVMSFMESDQTIKILTPKESGTFLAKELGDKDAKTDFDEEIVLGELNDESGTSAVLTFPDGSEYFKDA